jgi:hypothetical protein
MPGGPAVVRLSSGMRLKRGLAAAKQLPQERRRWKRLSLAIPVFVRGISGPGKELVEFCTLLNESAGGALLLYTEILAASLSRIARDAVGAHPKKYEVSANNTYSQGARRANHPSKWLEPVRIAICETACTIIRKYFSRPPALQM